MLKLRGSNPRASIPSPFGSGIAFPSSTITFQPIPNKHDLFCLCFTAGRQPHTHFRTLLAEETSSSFIAFMHLCPLDLCSYAEKLANIHDFSEYKDSVSRHSGWNVNIIRKRWLTSLTKNLTIFQKYCQNLSCQRSYSSLSSFTSTILKF